MLDIIALRALFGSSIPISKKLLSFTSPILLTGLRMTCAGLLLLLFNLLWRKSLKGFKKELWLYYAQIIVVGVYLRYILRYWGLQHMPAVKTGFLISSTPFVAAIMSWFVFKERLSLKQWTGLLLGMLSYIPIIFTSSSSEIAVGELLYISWPEIAIFIAVIAQCYQFLISRRLLRTHKHSASVTNGICMFGGGVLALITATIAEPIAIQDGWEFAGWFALLILISNIICHNYLLYLLKHYSITFVSFTDFLTPIFTGLYSWYFLGEFISWHYLVSAGGIIIGLYLFYQDELKTTSIKASAV